MAKQNKLSIKFKIQRLKKLDTVDAVNKSKSEIGIKYGIPN